MNYSKTHSSRTKEVRKEKTHTSLSNNHRERGLMVNNSDLSLIEIFALSLINNSIERGYTLKELVEKFSEKTNQHTDTDYVIDLFTYLTDDGYLIKRSLKDECYYKLSTKSIQILTTSTIF